MKKNLLVFALLAISPKLLAQEPAQPDATRLQKMSARFAPTEITADVSKLSPNDRKVLARLVEVVVAR